jgi:flagellar hook-associated protein 1 FlgK
METEASVDRLFHTIATTINDLLAPNITAEEAGITTPLTVTDDKNNVYTINADTKILDAENCSVGADGSLPPQEMFTRLGTDRYTEVTDGNGNTYYLYNEEDSVDTAKMYCIKGCEVNLALLQEESRLPVYRQNGLNGNTGDVDYALGAKLQEIWDEALMTVNPLDNSPYTFEEYYDTMIDRLATQGNVYYESSTTLDTTVASLDNSRQQIMGVSSDEELTHMIKYQAAYNAASRYITVISEMTELICTGLI